MTPRPHALIDFLWLNFGWRLEDWADGEIPF